MLYETTPAVIEQAVLADLASHLKLPDDPGPSQMDEAEAALRAAVAHLEARLSLAFIPRNFVWTAKLPAGTSVPAPIGPVRSIESARSIGAAGDAADLSVAAFALEKSELRCRVRTKLSLYHEVELTFSAGFGEDWYSTPPDLRRAAFMLAAVVYDDRHGDVPMQTPGVVAALIAPWTRMRLGAGVRS